MRLIAYVRVSTRSQNYDGQIDAINAFAKIHNHEIVQLFHEKESGSKDRPELNKALAAVENADGLISTKIDRVSRSFKQFVNMVTELEKENKCLVCVQQNIDTSDHSPTGRAFVRMLAIFAELEREFILERITEGRERTRAAGGRLGGPNPKELDMDVVKALRKQGLSFVNIAKKMPIKVSPTLINNRLKAEGIK